MDKTPTNNGVTWKSEETTDIVIKSTCYFLKIGDNAFVELKSTNPGKYILSIHEPSIYKSSYELEFGLLNCQSLDELLALQAKSLQEYTQLINSYIDLCESKIYFTDRPSNPVFTQTFKETFETTKQLSEKIDEKLEDFIKQHTEIDYSKIDIDADVDIDEDINVNSHTITVSPQQINTKKRILYSAIIGTVLAGLFIGTDLYMGWGYTQSAVDYIKSLFPPISDTVNEVKKTLDVAVATATKNENESIVTSIAQKILSPDNINDIAVKLNNFTPEQQLSVLDNLSKTVNGGIDVMKALIDYNVTVPSLNVIQTQQTITASAVTQNVGMVVSKITDLLSSQSREYVSKLPGYSELIDTLRTRFNGDVITLPNGSQITIQNVANLLVKSDGTFIAPSVLLETLQSTASEINQLKDCFSTATMMCNITDKYVKFLNFTSNTFKDLPGYSTWFGLFWSYIETFTKNIIKILRL